MNELKIEFGDAGYLYFKTNQQTCDKAFDDFLQSLEDIGVNIDNINLEYETCVLRDANYNDIDHMSHPSLQEEHTI